MREENMRNRSNNIEGGELSEMLEAPGQQAVRQLVKAMPEDTVSLQWRSSLNERLLALAPVKKKISALVIGFRALAGLGLASLLCLAVISRLDTSKPSIVQPSSGSALASALLDEHRHSVDSGEIAGPGVADGDVDSQASAQNSSDDADKDFS
jgi:hypothetical protein